MSGKLFSNIQQEGPISQKWRGNGFVACEAPPGSEISDLLFPPLGSLKTSRVGWLWARAQRQANARIMVTPTVPHAQGSLRERGLAPRRFDQLGHEQVTISNRANFDLAIEQR